MARKSRRKREVPTMGRFALLMASVCVRNTVIEEYHSHGSLSQGQMKAFNREVANKICTFLELFLSGSPQDTEAFLNSSLPIHPYDWDDPVIDRGILGAVKAFERGESHAGDWLDDEPPGSDQRGRYRCLQEKRDAH